MGGRFNEYDSFGTGLHPEECLGQGPFNPAPYTCPSPASGFQSQGSRCWWDGEHFPIRAIVATLP